MQLIYDVKFDIANAKRNLEQNLGNLNINTSKISSSFAKAGTDAAKRFGSTFNAGATRAIGAAISGASIGAGLFSVNAAREFESAFTGVLKTVDGLDDGFGVLTQRGAELRENFIDLSKEIPVAFKELSAIGEIGGQLGVPQEQLENFTKTIAQIGVSTNLTSERAASDFAKIANVLGDSLDQIDEYGSAVVALGNNFATTEADISEFSKRISAGGALVGLNAADIFAIGTAFSATGTQAEEGGSSIQKVLLTINNAVNGIGDGAAEDLGVLSSALGVTSDQFIELFRSNPAEAFTQLVEGIGSAGPAGAKILDDIGLSGVRVQKSFLAVAGAEDVLRDAISLANKEYEENNALTEEAQRRFATFDSQLQIFRNTTRAAGASIGAALLPAINDILKAVSPLIDSFARFAQQNPRLIKNVLLAGAAFGGLFLAIGTIAPIIGTITAAFSPAGIAIAAVAVGLGLLVKNFASANGGFKNLAKGGINSLTDKLRSARDTFNNFKEAIRTFAQSNIGQLIRRGIEDTFNRLRNVFSELGGAFAGLFDALRAFAPIAAVIGGALAVIGKVILDTVLVAVKFLIEALTDVFKVIEGLSDFIVGVFSGDMKKAFLGLAKVFEGFANFFIDAINKVIDGINRFGKLTGKIFGDGIPQIQNLTQATDAAAGSIEDLIEPTEDAEDAHKDLADAFEETSDQAKDLNENIKDLTIDMFDQFEQTLEVEKAQQEYNDTLAQFGPNANETILALGDLRREEQRLSEMNSEISLTTQEYKDQLKGLVNDTEAFNRLNPQQRTELFQTGQQMLEAARKTGVNDTELANLINRFGILSRTPKNFTSNVNLKDNATGQANDVRSRLSSFFSRNPVSVAVNAVQGVLNRVRDGIQNFFNGNPISVAVNAVQGAVGNFFSRFATGGLVNGPGTGTSDSIPARLSNGEFVIKAASVRAFGLENLRAINQSGQLPGNVTNNSNRTYNNYGGRLNFYSPYRRQGSYY